MDHQLIAGRGRDDRLSRLRHLELNGRVLKDADPVAAMCAILRQAPDLESLTLIFETAPLESFREFRGCTERELRDTHSLHYNQCDTLDYEPPAAIPPCLRSRVKEINLVHYQGGRAQRTLARFLLGNAPLLEKLCCVFAQGPLWIQTKLMLEMEGWVVSYRASKEFC